MLRAGLRLRQLLCSVRQLRQWLCDVVRQRHRLLTAKMLCKICWLWMLARSLAERALLLQLWLRLQRRSVLGRMA
jgi:hypothetical protein